MTTNDRLQNYYASLNKKDAGWQDMWSDDALFADASGVLNAKGKEAVIASFTPFLKSVVRVSVKQLIVEGNTACAIAAYEYVNQKGEKLAQDVAEIWNVSGDKLKQLTIYFDLTAYRAFMRPKP